MLWNEMKFTFTNCALWPDKQTHKYTDNHLSYKLAVFIIISLMNLIPLWMLKWMTTTSLISFHSTLAGRKLTQCNQFDESSVIVPITRRIEKKISIDQYLVDLNFIWLILIYFEVINGCANIQFKWLWTHVKLPKILLDYEVWKHFRNHENQLEIFNQINIGSYSNETISWSLTNHYTVYSLWPKNIETIKSSN